MTDTKTNRSNSVLFECVLIGILFILSIRLTSYISLVVLLICSYIAIKKDYEAVICMFMFILSFVFVFKLNVGSGFAFINIVEVVFLLRLVLEKQFKFSKSNRFLVMALCIYLLLISANSGLKECSKVITSFLLGAALFNDNKKSISLSRITEYASAGILLSGVIALMNTYFPRLEVLIDNSRIKLGQGMYYYRFAGLLENPNFYSVFPSILIAVYLVLLYNKKCKLLDYFYLAVNIIFGLMSSSMSFVVCLAIIFFLFFMNGAVSGRKHVFVYLVLFLLILTSFYIVKDTDFMSSVTVRIERVMDEDSSSEEKTSGRTVIWGMYYDYFSQNVLRFIFGCGLGQDATEAIGHQSHNTYIEVFYYIGFLGFILYAMTVWNIYGPFRYGIQRINFISALPFIALLIRATARCLLKSEFLVFLMIMGALSVWNYSDKEARNKVRLLNDSPSQD